MIIKRLFAVAYLLFLFSRQKSGGNLAKVTCSKLDNRMVQSLQLSREIGLQPLVGFTA